MALIRRGAAFWERDRAFAPDLEATRRAVLEGDFVRFVPELAETGDARAYG